MCATPAAATMATAQLAAARADHVAAVKQAAEAERSSAAAALQIALEVTALDPSVRGSECGKIESAVPSWAR